MLALHLIDADWYAVFMCVAVVGAAAVALLVPSLRLLALVVLLVAFMLAWDAIAIAGW